MLYRGGQVRLSLILKGTKTKGDLSRNSSNSKKNTSKGKLGIGLSIYPIPKALKKSAFIFKEKSYGQV